MISKNEDDVVRILLIKPYQPTRFHTCMPPLGLLYLVSTLREQFGSRVEIRLIDAVLERKRWHDLEADLAAFRPHLVGLSALNWQARESGRIAHLIKQKFPETIVALGGPFAHRNTARICATKVFDWIFDGEADLSFPITVERWFYGDRDLGGIVGLTWRSDSGYRTNGCPSSMADGKLVGVVEDLDQLPLPAWDLVDFDAYAAELNMNLMLRGRRYAPLFTSRGCPFLCTYCHDIFGKRFRWRSPENVLAEVRLLRETYGVDELEIIDDIFNMNSPRMREVCRGIAPLKMHLCFPNGLRFDILDEQDVNALVEAGTYSACVAIETVTPRLQDMVRKRLRLDAALRSIGWMTQRGASVEGFFMIGFPTETAEEIEATIRWAVNSDLTLANFFLVVPQPGTPLHDVALKEAPHAFSNQIMQEYCNGQSWYQDAYGVDLARIQRQAHLRFYIRSPRRWWRMLRTVRWRDLLRGAANFVEITFFNGKVTDEPLPDALLPLGEHFTDEAGTETSAMVLNRLPRELHAFPAESS